MLRNKDRTRAGSVHLAGDIDVKHAVGWRQVEGKEGEEGVLSCGVPDCR